MVFMAEEEVMLATTCIVKDRLISTECSKDWVVSN